MLGPGLTPHKVETVHSDYVCKTPEHRRWGCGGGGAVCRQLAAVVAEDTPPHTDTPHRKTLS